MQPLPRLDARRYRERALHTRLMMSHEHALELHLARVVRQTGKIAAAMHRDHGHGGMQATMAQFGQRLRAVLRPSLLSTAREFGNRVMHGGKSALGGETKAFEDLDYAIQVAIDEHVGTRITQVTEATQQLIVEIIRRGLEEGWSEGEVAAAIEDAMSGEMADWRARRIARTETHTAANIGQYEAAQASPLQYVKEWLATEDPRTREDHAAANGQQVALDEPFLIGPNKIRMMYPGDPTAPPGQIINCFVGETVVSGAITAATRHWHDGDVVEVTTALGHKLTGTPNHPVLTREGWVPLRMLKVGSYVVSCVGSRIDDQSHAAPLSDAEHVDNVEPSIEQVFDALAVHRALVRHNRLAVNFHGDVPTQDVDIVATDGVLQAGSYAPLIEQIAEHHLALSDLTQGALLGDSLSGQFNVAASGSAPGVLSGKCQPLPLIGGSCGHAQEHCLTSPARRDASLEQAAEDATASDAERLGQSLNGSAVRVQLDQVVDVNVRAFRGHVFNLETVPGFYEANGIVVHNCRCTVLYLPAENQG